ncbi:MAG: methionine adenosyltransferase [Clostridiales bacterium]|jgi:S-adenosylmethionine synthetase|nr:methionine adenosyltransferase [Clostridiales bacterium]
MLFTSESVTEGHPDKICDQVSDAVLDAILAQDKNAHVACETLATTGLILVAGEISTDCYVDMEALVRRVVREIGYDRAKYGFDCETCSVITAIKNQSPDIAMGVNNALEAREGENDSDFSTGAGDQGMMFGFACDETDVYMPMPIYLAHKLTRNLTAVRKSGELGYLRPDGKSLVTVEYDGDKPVRVPSVVVSSQHSPAVDSEAITRDIIERVIKPVIPAWLLKDTKYYINPTGRFVVGGPMGDCGLTGRKIIVDTYGGYARHGGGAFSGKDPTKVDRSAAYMARYIAKNIVAAGLAKKCELQVSYAIGVARPLGIRVDTFGTGALTDEKIADIVSENFDLRPAAIIRHLDLLRPIYRQTAAYGHFGRDDLNLPWEQLDMASTLKQKYL